jgi:hypothetical protein
VHRLAALTVALCVLTACSDGGDGDEAGSTTAVTTTTLPQSSTTSTVPDRAVTEVDVCALLNDGDLASVLDDAGPGDPAPTEERDADGGVPALVTAACAWPSADDPALVLNYLAPTTAADGPTHLRDVLAAGTGFAEGGQVITQESGRESVGFLVDPEQQLREVAVVKRSALLWLLVDHEVSGRDTEALDAYAALVVAALSRAPR